VLERLTWAVARQRRWVIGGLLLAVVAALILGRGMFRRLGYPVFFDPKAESTRAANLARSVFGDSDPDVLALYQLPDDVARRHGVEDPRVHEALRRALDAVGRDPAVARIVSQLTPGASQRFISTDRRSTFVLISLRGTPRAKADALPRLAAQLGLALEEPGRGGQLTQLRPQLGGQVPAGLGLTHLAETSLVRGERLALPFAAILLIAIFGSAVAALLPVVLGGLAIVLALGLLSVLSHVLAIDAFAINVVTILGLGVAIDYALFLISRYREERFASGDDGVDEEVRTMRALARAVATTGRLVLFSGITVVASLAGLLVFGQPFLRSVAIGGMAVVLLAALLALVAVPALISMLGPRLERGRRPHLFGFTDDGSHEFWRNLARSVVQHRVAICVGATVGLMLLATPFARLQPSRADVRSLPPNEEARRVAEILPRDFPETAMTPLSVVVEMREDIADGDQLGDLFDYTERLKALPTVQRVESMFYYAQVRDRSAAEELQTALQQVVSRPSSPRAQALGAIMHGRYARVSVISSAQPDSTSGQKLVEQLRAVAPPPDARAQVFGHAAAMYDSARSMRDRVPWMMLVVCSAMFLVLFIAFRSAILPLTAMAMTTLSLTASFGAIVYIFQDGRLQSLLNYQALGTTDASLPVVMFAVIFGLSMDYEILILGRIREAYQRTRDTEAAIVEGVARTGRLVTGAASIMVVVFSAFAAAPLVFIKALGLGMALAIALDATVVRMLLVPSTMALLGRWNWWTPSWPRLRHWRDVAIRRYQDV
jgi:RND superfamily putative drug exporter